jgi:hypothetical protein
MSLNSIMAAAGRQGPVQAGLSNNEKETYCLTVLNYYQYIYMLA